MLDGKLLAAAIASRAAWDRIAPHFTGKDLSPQAGFWFELVREWYSRDPQARAVDRSLLIESGKQKLVGSKHADTLLGWIVELPEPPSAETWRRWRWSSSDTR
jgi:hypothetical protein